MVGIIVRYDGWDKNIFKEMFAKINLNNIKFTIKYWESYGDLYEDYNDIDSNTFKNILFICSLVRVNVYELAFTFCSPIWII